MPMRRGLGPVFESEWLTTSRRWQVYACRALFVSVLLVGLWSVWVSRDAGQSVPTLQFMADVGRGFFSAIVFTQIKSSYVPPETGLAFCGEPAPGEPGLDWRTDGA